MTVHLLIKGKVQGVFYRASAKDVAEQLYIKGWIRNTNEGDVESIASGDEDRIKEFIEWCKKGPRRAEVTNVIVTESKNESFAGFKIIR
jgi:acylphosphatase